MMYLIKLISVFSWYIFQIEIQKLYDSFSKQSFIDSESFKCFFLILSDFVDCYLRSIIDRLTTGALVVQWLVRWVRDLKICSSNPHPAQYFLVILQCNLNDSESINGCSLKESYNFWMLIWNIYQLNTKIFDIKVWN